VATGVINDFSSVPDLTQPTSTPVTASPDIQDGEAASTAGAVTDTASSTQFSSIVASFSPTRALGTAKLLTLSLLLTLFIVYFMTHFAVWRKNLKVWENSHYRWIALLQLAGLAAFISYLASSGIGTVG
jgi:hypothetical protein